MNNQTETLSTEDMVKLTRYYHRAIKRDSTLSRCEALYDRINYNLEFAVEMMLFRISLDEAYLQFINNNNHTINDESWKYFKRVRKDAIQYIHCFIGRKNEEEALQEIYSINQDAYHCIKSYYELSL